MESRKVLAAMLSAVIAVCASYADEGAVTGEQKQAVNAGLKDFSRALLTAVPQATSQDNVWADAYIGPLFPTNALPHFGGGVSMGLTQLDMRGFKDAAGALAGIAQDLEQGFNIPETFYLPSVSVDIRTGGILLPMDIGFSAMMTNPSIARIDISNPASVTGASSGVDFSLKNFKGVVNYMVIGLDARFRLIKETGILPAVSLGAGWFYTKGSFSVDSGTKDTGASASINLSYESNLVFAQVQVSKNILFLTLFGGARGMLSSTSTAWNWSCSANGEILGQDDGHESLDTLSTNFIKTIQPQIFLGTGFNILCFQGTVSVCTDLRSAVTAIAQKDANSLTWSGAVSLRAKL